MSDSTMQLTVVLKRPQDDEQSALSRAERAAVSLALRLRDELGGAVTAVALGHPERETQTNLCEALGAGCDRAVCVWPQDTGETQFDLDLTGEAALMSAALRALGSALLLCGDRSESDGQGVFASVFAAQLAMPHLTAVVSATGGDRPGTVIAEQRGDGRVHRFRCALPVVFAVLADLGRAPVHADPAPVDPSRVEHVELSGLPVAASARPAHVPDTAVRTPAVIATSADELVAQLAADRILQ